jgi:hypothetical protein
MLPAANAAMLGQQTGEIILHIDACLLRATALCLRRSQDESHERRLIGHRLRPDGGSEW